MMTGRFVDDGNPFSKTSLWQYLELQLYVKNLNRRKQGNMVQGVPTYNIVGTPYNLMQIIFKGKEKKKVLVAKTAKPIGMSS